MKTANREQRKRHKFRFRLQIMQLTGVDIGAWPRVQVAVARPSGRVLARGTVGAPLPAFSLHLVPAALSTAQTIHEKKLVTLELQGQAVKSRGALSSMLASWTAPWHRLVGFDVDLSLLTKAGGEHEVDVPLTCPPIALHLRVHSSPSKAALLDLARLTPGSPAGGGRGDEGCTAMGSGTPAGLTRSTSGKARELLSSSVPCTLGWAGGEGGGPPSPSTRPLPELSRALSLRDGGLPGLTTEAVVEAGLRGMDSAPAEGEGGMGAVVVMLSSPATSLVRHPSSNPSTPTIESTTEVPVAPGQNAASAEQSWRGVGVDLAPLQLAALQVAQCLAPQALVEGQADTYVVLPPTAEAVATQPSHGSSPASVAPPVPADAAAPAAMLMPASTSRGLAGTVRPRPTLGEVEQVTAPLPWPPAGLPAPAPAAAGAPLEATAAIPVVPLSAFLGDAFTGADGGGTDAGSRATTAGTSTAPAPSSLPAPIENNEPAAERGQTSSSHTTDGSQSARGVPPCNGDGTDAGALTPQPPLSPPSSHTESPLGGWNRGGGGSTQHGVRHMPVPLTPNPSLADEGALFWPQAPGLFLSMQRASSGASLAERVMQRRELMLQALGEEVLHAAVSGATLQAEERRRVSMSSTRWAAPFDSTPLAEGWAADHSPALEDNPTLGSLEDVAHGLEELSFDTLATMVPVALCLSVPAALPGMQDDAPAVDQPGPASQPHSAQAAERRRGEHPTLLPPPAPAGGGGGLVGLAQGMVSAPIVAPLGLVAFVGGLAVGTLSAAGKAASLLGQALSPTRHRRSS